MTEDFSWIISSPGSKVLRSRESQQVVNERLISLHQDNENRSKTLHLICERIIFSDYLYSSTSIRVSDDQNSGRTDRHLEALSRYLLLTCIDAAAGKPNHIGYDEWVGNQLSLNPPHQELQIHFRKIAAENNPESVSTLVDSLIKHTYTGEYLDKHGVGRKFKSFIKDDLPDWLSNWLVDAYYFFQRNESVTDIMIDQSKGINWETLDKHKKLDKIANYLYEIRNSYTHTVYKTVENGFLNFTIRGQQYRVLEVRNLLDDKVSREICILENVMESDILRLILVTRMRMWLGLKDDASLLKNYFTQAKYRHLGYHFLRELDNNKRLLLEWISAIHYVNHEIHIHPLSDAAAKEFISYHNELYNSITFSLSSQDRYLRDLKIINQGIEILCSKKPHISLNLLNLRDNKDALVRIFLNSKEMGDTLRRIKNLYLDLLRRIEISLY